MDSLNDLIPENHPVGGLVPDNKNQSYAKRAERRMLLEQVAMAILAAGLFLAIV